MYAAPNRRTSHRLAALDVQVPFWMRAPDETPGMFGPEIALDELAAACGLDPIELRTRNEPEKDPESGNPWWVRQLTEWLRGGAQRFGWDRRDPTPGVRRQDGWLVGTGVVSSTCPYLAKPGSRAAIRYLGNDRYQVRIGAADIGTGTWTALTQIAADALGCPVAAVALKIGDTELPIANVQGVSMGISCWGGAVVAAAQAFREAHGDRP
jgi:xanthine dehydrogenase YagR molybdenum-binding subunit